MIRLQITIFLLVLALAVSAQDRLNAETDSQSGRRSGRSESFKNLARARMDVSGINAVMVLSSFDTWHTRATNTREGLYKLTDGSSESQVVRQTLKTSDGKDKGIGTLVHIFDVSTSSGQVNFILQHASSIQQPVNSSGTVVAIGLTSSESFVDIPYDLKSISSPVYTSGTPDLWTPVNGLSTSGVLLASEGSIYLSASINGFADGSGAGEWKLQYSSNQSNWVDIGQSTSLSFAFSQEYAISSLSWIMEDLPAGTHYFRMAHRQTEGSAGDVRTMNSNLIACALVYEVAPGITREFPSFSLENPSSTTSATSMSPVINHSIDPSGPTDLFLQAQYVAGADAETDAAVYDLAIDQSVLDGVDQYQYLSSSTYTGSGGSMGLGTSLQAGTSYGISLRHQTASGTSLTTRNASLSGFQLSSVGISIWTGDGISPSTWENSDNWIGLAPGDRDNAIIPGNVTDYPILTTSTSCEDLRLESGASLTLNPVSSLTVHGRLDNSGSLEVLSDGSNSGSLIVAGQASGQVSYQSHLTADQWHIVAPPVSGQSIQSFIHNPTNQIPENTTYNFYGLTDYSEANNGWNSFFTESTGGDFLSGKGYLMRREISDGSVTATGSLIDSDFSMGIAASSSGWNAVGNPFSSAIGVTSDANTSENFLTTNLDQLDPNYSVLYLWDEADGYDGTQNNYKVIGNSGYIDTHNYPELDMDYIQAGQGFLVKSVTGGGSLLFSKAMQTHQNGIPVLKSAQVSWDGFKLVVESENRRESTTLCFHEKMSPGLDPSFDAGLLNSKPDFSIYSILSEEDLGIHFKIQCLPYPVTQEWVIPIGVDYKTGGEVSFFTEGVIMHEQSEIYMEDRLTGQIFDISSEADSFRVFLDEGGVEPGRFFLRINTPDVTWTGPDQSREQAFYGYYHMQHITLRGMVREGSVAILYDMGGRNLGIFSLQEGDLHHIPVSGLENGLYLLEIIDGFNRSAVKILKNE